METPGAQPTVTRSVADQPEELARAISAPLLFFYVLGDVLGSGIYALIGVMAAQVGGAFWTSFVVGVAAAMLTGFAYAELITKYPHAAGAAMYTGRAFNNRFFTFLVAFCTVAASLAATGALALAFGGYFLELLVALFSVPLLLAALVFVVVLAFINFRGIAESVKLNLAMSITEITGLTLVLVIGVVVLLAGDANLSRPFDFNEGSNPALLALTGATLAFFAMTGFENAANVAEEVQNPSRVYPRALLGGMASAGLIYLIIAFIASMVTPLGQLAGSEVALLEVVRQGFPAFPGWLFAIIACIAVTNTCLVALITNSRIMYGMAREGVVPRIFARTHQSRRTPWVAIVFTTIIALVLIVGVGEEGVNTLASATVAFLLAVFTLVCLCALVLRRDRVPHENYTAPTVILILGVVVNAALLLYVLVTDIQGLAAGDTGIRESVVVVCLVMLLIGVGLYFVNNLAQQARPVAAGRRTRRQRVGGGRIMTHVLIATDGSEQSLKAARYLRSLLDPASLERVSVVAVVRPLAAVPFASDFGEEEHAAQQAGDPGGYSFHRAAQEAVERVAGELRDMTPNVETIVRSGAPADQIIRVADEVEADLIVIGGRGKGAVEAIVLGSVAYRVLHHAPCPVLVTR